jgi:hypothetical protein
MENNNNELRETKNAYQKKLEELMTYYSQGDPEENRDFYTDKLKAVQEAYRDIGK